MVPYMRPLWSNFGINVFMLLFSISIFSDWWSLNPIALGKAKIVYNFGLSECNRVKIENENNIFYFLVQ